MPQPSCRKALLIIDMQVGLFHGAVPPFAGDRVLANINQLIANARSAGAPILAVRHTGPQGSPLAPDGPLTQLIPQMDVQSERDILFSKTRPNCFHETELAPLLRQRAIDELVVVGMKTEFCIDSTCRAAADGGWKVTLIADAHTTMDTAAISADAIVAHHNATLSAAFVTLSTAQAYSF